MKTLIKPPPCITGTTIIESIEVRRKMSGIMSFVVRSSSRSLGLSPRVSRCCIIPTTTTTTSASRRQQHCCSLSTCSASCNCSCHLLSSKAAAAAASSSASVLSQHRFFASSSSSSAVAKKLTSDQKLSRVIESEIQCAQEEENDGLIQGNNLPDGFPFEIIDNPGEETITLKREFEGESIQVLVYMPLMDGQDGGQDDDNDDDNDDDQVSGQVSISMNVTVVKGDGPRLEFSCTASPDDIAIDSMLMKGPEDSSKEIPYEGPEFSDLDENLQNELHGYLERRGIKPSLTNFLQEYMVNKDSKEYLNWLKNMKEFVEK